MLSTKLKAVIYFENWAAEISEQFMFELCLNSCFVWLFRV